MRKSPQKEIGSIDWSKDPVVVVSTNNPYFHPHKFTERDFDCETLLDYLGQPASSNEYTKLPLQILSTGQDNVNSDSSPQVFDDKSKPLRDLNCYNVSVESGVVLDSDLDTCAANVRKMSTASINLSHGSSQDIAHSYIGMGNDDFCACMECRLQRERVYPSNCGCGASQMKQISQAIGDLDMFSKDCVEPYCRMSNQNSKESCSLFQKTSFSTDKQMYDADRDSVTCT